MAEVVEWLEGGDLDAYVVVRAAMAHLPRNRQRRLPPSPRAGLVEQTVQGRTTRYRAAEQLMGAAGFEPATSRV
jgi:hypothetical protein